LISEGNFTDDKLLAKHNIKVTQTNTTGLSLSIGMTLEQMVYYINSAFTLELARVEELVMHFTQIRYVYN
jgi:hypothetical protein